MEQIQAALDNLAGESARILKNNTVSFDEARLLAGYITELRQLLDELWQLEGARKPDESRTVALYRMKERFFELEGMIKERRNSLAQGLH